MTDTELWSENDLLRKRLLDLKASYEREREERLKLQAENLWLKRLLSEQEERPVPGPRGGSVKRIR